MTKSELRKDFLAKRAQLSQDDRVDASRQIADKFFLRFDLSAVRYLHCFIPVERFNEIDTMLIFQRLWSDHPNVQTLAPVIDLETGNMQSIRVTPETELIENSWNILEPPAGDHIDTGEIDIVLVPLLCFDEQGHRVGYGKGYYDRFLSETRDDCLKIGLSYFPAVTRIADVGEHDVKLDLCITPGKIYRSRD